LSERYVSGGCGEWDKQEGSEVELEALKDSFVFVLNLAATMIKHFV